MLEVSLMGLKFSSNWPIHTGMYDRNCARPYIHPHTVPGILHHRVLITCPELYLCHLFLIFSSSSRPDATLNSYSYPVHISEILYHCALELYCVTIAEIRPPENKDHLTIKTTANQVVLIPNSHCSCDTAKPILRDHCCERPPV